jgi:uncharacterized protein (TIGR03083 family)
MKGAMNLTTKARTHATIPRAAAAEHPEQRSWVTLKENLLRQADEAFEALEAAFAGLDEGQLTRPGLDRWSVRDVLAHLTGWHGEMIPVLGRLARGEKPLPDGGSYEDVDAWNARFVDARRYLSAAAVLEALRVSHRAFLDAARQIPEERFAPGKTATRIVDLNGPHHYREHAGEIAEWRGREGI